MDATLHTYVVEVLVGLTLLGVGAIVRSSQHTKNELKDTNKHLGKINGQVGTIQQWCRDHEQIDMTRHHELRQDITEVRGMVMEVRKD